MGSLSLAPTPDKIIKQQFPSLFGVRCSTESRRQENCISNERYTVPLKPNQHHAWIMPTHYKHFTRKYHTVTFSVCFVYLLSIRNDCRVHCEWKVKTHTHTHTHTKMVHTTQKWYTQHKKGTHTHTHTHAHAHAHKRTRT